MPLFLVFECCKCRTKNSHTLWSISSDHKYSFERTFCSHFNVDIDHESTIGFFGFGWMNKIKIAAYYKPSASRKTIFSKIFQADDTEYEDYAVFDNKVVFQARISDYKGQYPNFGNFIQYDIEYNKNKEEERLNKLR